jgi:serine/threonine protein kinase
VQCELPPSESTRIGVPGGVNKVAVKVLYQSDKYFEREVQICCALSDVNLARLLAYCNTNIDDTEGRDCKGPILIYEYMEKGSLGDYIFGTYDNFLLYLRTPISIVKINIVITHVHIYTQSTHYTKTINFLLEPKL